MKMKVEVEGQTFEVEVGDLSARPIAAVVDGEPFEVWPEEVAPVAPGPDATSATHEPRPAPAPASQPPRRSRLTPAEPETKSDKVVHAPLPGVIDSVAVRPGDEVTAGQPLCVIEAMKMKNVIRAPRSGAVAAVDVAMGQHVKHNDPLVEYEDA